MANTKVIKKYFGLEYLTVVVKLAHSGNVSAEDAERMEEHITSELLKKSVLIRGKEVRFMRKSLGLSARALAEMLGLSHVAVLKWEKEPKRALERTNAIAFRAVIAALLRLDIQMRDLVAPPNENPKIEFKWKAS